MQWKGCSKKKVSGCWMTSLPPQGSSLRCHRHLCRFSAPHDVPPIAVVSNGEALSTCSAWGWLIALIITSDLWTTCSSCAQLFPSHPRKRTPDLGTRQPICWWCSPTCFIAHSGVISASPSIITAAASVCSADWPQFITSFELIPQWISLTTAAVP